MDFGHEQEKHGEKVAETPASPASPPSSPSHEFSFTVSLHSSSTLVPEHKTKSATPKTPPFAIDLSPADDIFFHGHLLPLQFRSRLPISSCVTTNTLDGFSMPMGDCLDERKEQQNPEKNCSNCSINKSNQMHESAKGRKSSKSLAQLFGFKRWSKGCEVKEKENEGDDKKNKRKLRFELSQVIKKYARMVRPLLFFKAKRDDLQSSDRKNHDSFLGNFSLRRGRSADYSVRMSPKNKGRLLGTSSLPATTSSTAEELEAAIEAAIAHCKNSIAVEDKPES